MIEHKMQWRYATKKFNIEKKVSEEDITEMLKVTNLSPSAFGLQPFKMLVIKDIDLQQKLHQVSFQQDQIIDASHIVVFAANKLITEKDIDAYIARIAEVRDQKVEDLEEYRQMMLGFAASMTPEQQRVWAQKQAYIAAETLLISAADKKIDACPMEGFDPEAYNLILGLEDENLYATLVVALGYRSEHDEYQYLPKVRKELSHMVKLYYKNADSMVN